MSVTDQNWDLNAYSLIDEGSRYYEFEQHLNSIDEKILKLVQVALKCQKPNPIGNKPVNHDDELKVALERNKKIRNEIDNIVQELTQQKIQYDKYKTDQKLLSQEIKETHEAFLMAKKFYKKYLKMYYTIESKSCENSTVYVQFFTEAKKESENYSLRLIRDAKSGCYQLLSTTPKLFNQKELQDILQETSDIPGALCCIRQAFIAMKINKK